MQKRLILNTQVFQNPGTGQWTFVLEITCGRDGDLLRVLFDTYGLETVTLRGTERPDLQAELQEILNKRREDYVHAIVTWMKVAYRRLELRSTRYPK